VVSLKRVDVDISWGVQVRGNKSLAYRLTGQALNRTLNDQEGKLREKAIQKLEKELKAKSKSGIKKSSPIWEGFCSPILYRILAPAGLGRQSKFCHP
jgi:hypothetical protein